MAGGVLVVALGVLVAVAAVRAVRVQVLREDLPEAGTQEVGTLLADSGYGFAIHTEHGKQYSERGEDASEEAAITSPESIKTVVVTKAVPYSPPQPHAVAVERRRPYVVKVPAREPEDKPYEVTVLKPYAVPHAAGEPVRVRYEVQKQYAVHVPIHSHKPYKGDVTGHVYVKAAKEPAQQEFAASEEYRGGGGKESGGSYSYVFRHR